jgi:hypothetical protein
VQAKPSRGPWLWPLALALIGVILLLDNFLLLGDFNVTLLWPLLLVVAGAQILLRGDLLPDDSVKTFGITRGSVESAILEISAADIDVQVRALQREGRLIAGQFANQSRPQMSVNDTQAHLKMNRSATPWLSFSPWEMGLARDLPWQIYITSSLGQVNIDLSNLITEGGLIATGLGDIRVVSPYESFSPLRIHSSVGNIQFIAPAGHHVQVSVSGGRLFGIHVDESRYTQLEPGLYTAYDADEHAPLVEVHLSGTFGDAYLA